MTKALLAVFAVFTFVNVSQATTARPFDEVMSELNHGKIDLGNKADFDMFITAVSSEYPASAEFFRTSTQTSLIMQILEKIIRNQYIPGLYTSQIVCQYGRFSIKLGTEIPLPVDTSLIPRENLRMARRIASRFNVRLINLQEHSFQDDSYTSVLQLQVGCTMGNDWLTFNGVSLLMGDGAINGEIDLEGREVEGGIHIPCACFLVNAMQCVLENAMFREYIDEHVIKEIQIRLTESALVMSYLKSLEGNPEKYMIFENFVLDRLRDMKVHEEILLSNGFRNHAVLIVIEKKSTEFYDVLLYNTGAGAEINELTYRDGQKKALGAKRFTRLTLLALKTTSFLQKIAEMTGISHLKFSLPSRETAISDSQETYSNYIISVLSEFEAPYTEKDLKITRLITLQRSGTCATRCLLSYICSKLDRKYRSFKLMLYNEVLVRAITKKWEEQHAVQMKRIIKFAIENHSRSLLRYSSERSENDPSLDMFSSNDIWKYKKLIPG